jgi:hypothetical protein
MKLTGHVSGHVLHNLYTPPNIIRLMKSKWTRWAGYVAHMGEMRNVYNLKGRDHAET